MTDKTITGKTVEVTIENPDQASTNFYWTLDSEKGAFNLQTTIRGILSSDQIAAHLNSTIMTTKHVIALSGVPKDLREKYSSAPAAKLPEPTPVEAIIAEVQKSDPVLQPSAQPTAQSATPAETFLTEKLAVTISSGKKYFKVKGGQWTKYGVTVWDEVLTAAGIPVGKLDAQEYNLSAYTATFIRKADGKPDKVIKLEKAA